MKYNPIEFFKSLYNNSVNFVKSHLKQDGLEAEIDKKEDITDAARKQLREIVAQQRILLQYAAAARCAEFDMRYKQQPLYRSFGILKK